MTNPAPEKMKKTATNTDFIVGFIFFVIVTSFINGFIAWKVSDYRTEKSLPKEAYSYEERPYPLDG